MLQCYILYDSKWRYHMLYWMIQAVFTSFIRKYHNSIKILPYNNNDSRNKIKDIDSLLLCIQLHLIKTSIASMKTGGMLDYVIIYEYIGIYI